MVRVAAVVLFVAALSLFWPGFSDAEVAALAGLVIAGAMALGMIDDRRKRGKS
jgi:UDP-N-acetylmuramyl pentapeptide phosphotransferase/UDP-N-acetylglucosamine-1-phosphate transferase